MLGADELLKHAHVEPFFGPLLGGALQAVLPHNPRYTSESVRVLQNSFKLMKTNKAKQQETQLVLDEVEKSTANGELTPAESAELKGFLNNAQE